MSPAVAGEGVAIAVTVGLIAGHRPGL